MRDYRLNPEDITTDLYNFITSGCGILTGNPGAGKSYEIRKLIKKIQKEEIPVLFLPIDKIIAESDTDLQTELDLKKDLFDYIASQDDVSSTRKGIVIIDAFDAARSGTKRNFFIKLIRKIISRLSDEWNVLVVVRLFDAIKSSDLLEIFPSFTISDLNDQYKSLKTSKEIFCRHVLLPELSSEDVAYVLSDHPVLSQVSQDFNERLKFLLFNPFYITLAIDLVQNEKNNLKLKSVFSEVQLLALFWNSRIEKNKSSLKYDILLSDITKKMIANHSLSVSITDLSPSDADEINYFLSSGILSNVGLNKTKLAFVHNILFDYAVSRLIISDNEEGLIKFISEDRSRAVLLRPSIQYYLTNIWYLDKNLFKKICLNLYKNEREISLVTRIMPIQVLVLEADSTNDCKFVFSLYDGNSEYRNWLHATIFSALVSFDREIKSTNIPSTRFWLNYFERVIEDSKNPYDFNLVIWLAKIQEVDKRPDIQQQIGRISRRLFSTCLELRNTNPNIDAFASHLPVILVVKTFGTDPVQSRNILDKIFEISNDEDFDLSYLSFIAHNIKEIFPYDLEYVLKFYTFIFSRTEDSTKQTVLGNAGFFQLTSNRRQDFEGIRFSLGQQSESLINSNLEMGMRTLLKSINYGICREHIRPYPEDGRIEERIENFTFNNGESKFLRDYCYIWSDSHFHTDPEFEMLTQVKNRIILISERAEEPELVKIILKEFGDYVVVAYLWREVIKIISANPKPFSSVILDLVCASPLQRNSETINELAELIAVSIQYLSEDEIHQVVASIQKTFNEIEETHKKYFHDERCYLLSKIPLNYLPNDESTAVQNYLKKGDVPPRKPIEISEGGIRETTIDDILKFRKIDLHVEEHKPVLDHILNVKKFNDKWINEKLSEEEATSIFSSLMELYEIIDNQKKPIPQNIHEFSLYELSRCARILSRTIENPNSELFELTRNILLKSAGSSYTLNDDKITPEYDPLFWSPIPVTDAAEGLLNLYSLRSDEEIWASIKTLSQHEYPVVRSIIASNVGIIFNSSSEKFWEIVDSFIQNEENYKIHEILCNDLSWVCKNKPENKSKVIPRQELILNKSKRPGFESLGIINNCCFIELASYFAFVEDVEWAKSFTEDIIKKPEIYLKIRSRMVSLIISGYFKTPTIFNIKFDKARSQISRWINQILATTLQETVSLLEKTPEITDNNRKQFSDLYDVIDEYITRFYFAVDKEYSKISDPDQYDRAVRTIYNSEKETLRFFLETSLKMERRFIIRGHEMQYLIGLLDSCLGQDPEGVLNLTVKALKFGNRIGFSSDYLGKKEIQKFISHLLADHREILEKEKSMIDFTELLDNFAGGNSPEAIKYIMSLDLEYR